MLDYNKRLVEVDEILNYLSEENLLKIPEELRKTIKENKDKEYTWQYDETKSLKEQDVSSDTIAILSFLNMEYLLNEKQKQYMQYLHESNEKKLEEHKNEKYCVENLFKRNREEEQIEENTEVKAMVEYKEPLLKRIINKIKRFFGMD